MATRPGESVSVLLVEDTLDHLEALRRLLEGEGFSVITAENGEQAWNTLTAVRPGEAAPDIVVTDLRLPKLNGLELIQRIRATPGLGLIPIIAVTGEHEVTLERAQEYGANGILHKPVDSTVLTELILHLVS